MAKQGSMAKYGPRYGVRQKKIAAAVEKIQKQKHACPYCERPALSRMSAGIWFCRKCNNKFAGGAYFPSSAVGAEIIKMQQEKSAVPSGKIKA